MPTKFAAKVGDVLIHHSDIDFTVVAQPQEYVVHFYIFESTQVLDVNDQKWKPMWEKSNQEGDYTDDLEEAMVFAHGHVKWDGCSNWHYDTQDDCMIHGCSRSHLTRLGEILARCWDMTATFLPNWCGELE